jgi:predicted DNA-binding transcriptional regulator YafY
VYFSTKLSRRRAPFGAGLSVADGSVPAVNRTDRLYALVEDLRASAPRPRSARQLAARYEVSARTIERDILALQESGVPVYAEPGRRGGYAIDKTMTLPPVNFTAAEMVAIAVALARDERTPFAAATRSALRKVLAVAPAAQTAEAAQLIDRVRLIGAASPGRDAAVPAAALDAVAAPAGGGPVRAGPAHPAPGGATESAGPARPRSARERAASRWAGPQPGAVPLVIQEAITAGHVLRLDYRDRNDQVTVREVEPVAFAATRDQWYLLAWCRLRQGSRAFRLDRILAAVDTGRPAPPRSYHDLDVDIPDAVISRPDLHV